MCVCGCLIVPVPLYIFGDIPLCLFVVAKGCGGGREGGREWEGGTGERRMGERGRERERGGGIMCGMTACYVWNLLEVIVCYDFDIRWGLGP